MPRLTLWLILGFLAFDVLFAAALGRASYDLMHMLTGR